jgi:hypothetical protein
LRDLLLYETLPKESPKPERLRDEKYREKFGGNAEKIVKEKVPKAEVIIP